MSKDLQDILLLLTSASETLFNEDVLPCAVAAPSRESCCEAESKRLIAGNYARRSFDKYDPSRLCCGCQAYWHTAMARNALNTYIALQARYGGKK